MTDTKSKIELEIPIEAEPARPVDREPPKVPTCDPGDTYTAITAILQAIRRQRKRPLFAFITSTIDQATLEEVYGWKRQLREAGENGQLDILIDSGGGGLTRCYLIARLISRYTNAWEALVPTYAMSGATLICLGSCNIQMSEIAQLGPIDPQVISKRQQKFFASERQSPLEAFQAVKYLREFTLSSMDACMRFLLEKGIAAQKALETASTFAINLVGPIVQKIEPYDLGAFALDSSMAVHYCTRVGNPPDSDKKTQRNVAYRSLVEDFPAHEFAIDIAEAEQLKFNVSVPSPEIDELFDQLRPLLQDDQTYIGLVPEEEAAAS